MKILLPPLLVLLTPYAIRANNVTMGGSLESRPPVMPDSDSDRFIIRYKNGRGKSSAHTAAKKVRHADLGPHHNCMAVTLSNEALAHLQNDPDIEYIEPDFPRYPMRVRGYHDSNEEEMHNNKRTHEENHRKLAETVPYGIAMVQADHVFYNSSNPRTVCVVDGGYDLGHEDLPSINVDGYTNGELRWDEDLLGHGTHVAGTYLSMYVNCCIYPCM